MKIFIDIETRSKADLVEVGAWRYAEHSSTDVFCVAYKVEGNKVNVWVPGDSVPDAFHVNHQYTFVAHNALFEYALFANVLRKKYGFPLALADPLRWECTANMARCMALPGGLEPLCGVLKLGESKLAVGKHLIQTYSKPNRKGEFNPIPAAELDTMIMYCKQDVELTEKVYNRLAKYDNIAIEKPIMNLDRRQNIHGIHIDVKALKKIDMLVNAATLDAEKRMEEKGVNVRSPKQLQKYLKDNFNISIANAQEKTIKDILLNPNLDADARAMLELRLFLSRSSIKKYSALIDRVSPDGRLRYFLQYYRANTGRWSGVGFQPHNLPKGGQTEKEQAALLKDLLADKVPVIETMTAAKKVLPGMIIPDKGHVFLMGDFSAIEARVLAWIAGEKILIEAYRKGDDLYKKMAAVIYQKPLDDVTKKERHLGKSVILGAGYGMGHNRFFEVCQAQGLAINIHTAEKAIYTYRSSFKNIVQFWASIESAFNYVLVNKGKKVKVNGMLLHADKGYVSIKLPSGRDLYYHRVTRGPEGISFLNFAQNMTVKLWGGLITENIVQAIARDLLCHAMLELDKVEIFPIMSVHDEVVAQALTTQAKAKLKVFDTIMNVPPEWFKGFPLKTESFMSKRYFK